MACQVMSHSKTLNQITEPCAALAFRVESRINQAGSYRSPILEPCCPKPSLKLGPKTSFGVSRYTPDFSTTKVQQNGYEHLASNRFEKSWTCRCQATYFETCNTKRRLHPISLALSSRAHLMLRRCASGFHSQLHIGHGFSGGPLRGLRVRTAAT